MENRLRISGLRELLFEHECHIARSGIPRPVNGRHAADADDFLNLTSAEHTADMLSMVRHAPCFLPGEQRNGDVVAAASKAPAAAARHRPARASAFAAPPRSAVLPPCRSDRPKQSSSMSFRWLNRSLRRHGSTPTAQVMRFFLRMGARIRLGDLAAAAHLLHINWSSLIWCMASPSKRYARITTLITVPMP